MKTSLAHFVANGLFFIARAAGEQTKLIMPFYACYSFIRQFI